MLPNLLLKGLYSSKGNSVCLIRNRTIFRHYRAWSIPLLMDPLEKLFYWIFLLWPAFSTGRFYFPPSVIGFIFSVHLYPEASLNRGIESWTRTESCGAQLTGSSAFHSSAHPYLLPLLCWVSHQRVAVYPVYFFNDWGGLSPTSYKESSVIYLRHPRTYCWEKEKKTTNGKQFPLTNSSVMLDLSQKCTHLFVHLPKPLNWLQEKSIDVWWSESGCYIWWYSKFRNEALWETSGRVG